MYTNGEAKAYKDNLDGLVMSLRLEKSWNIVKCVTRSEQICAKTMAAYKRS